MSRQADPEKARVWRRRLDRYASCGLTIADFCEAERVSEATFQYWRRRLAEDRSSGAVTAGNRPASDAGFLPIRVSLATVEIHLPGGARVSIPSGETTALRIAIEAALQRAAGPESAS